MDFILVRAESREKPRHGPRRSAAANWQSVRFLLPIRKGSLVVLYLWCAVPGASDCAYSGGTFLV